MKKIFYIYFALTLASASTLFAAKNTTVKEMPPVTAAVPAAAPVESQRTPLPDATAWSFHTGSYAGNGILGGSLQFGLASWFR
ncbi:MAG TPA: hypothetical protein PLY93_02660, partial [Turneriella sp.]|nr:hypothetical protein [Turneriella sp.]